MRSPTLFIVGLGLSAFGFAACGGDASEGLGTSSGNAASSSGTSGTSGTSGKSSSSGASSSGTTTTSSSGQTSSGASGVVDGGGGGDASPGPGPTKQCTVTKDANGFFPIADGNNSVMRLPNDYDMAKPKPYAMVVAIHGCGDNTPNFAQWAAAPYVTRKTQNYIALSVGGRDGQCWNTQADEPKVTAAMAEAMACFYVHQKKVTIAGYSSGGELAYNYALKNAGKFAGILIEHSGIPDTNAPKNAAWKLNVAATGGTNDGDYPPSRFNGDWSLLRGLGFSIETQTLALTHDGTSDEWDQFLIPKIQQAKWIAP